MNRLIATLPAALALAFSMHAAWGQAFSSGSTGADLAFNPTANQTVTVRAGGVYNYTTVNIPSNVTIRYQRGLDNAPVIILATGNVVIDGSIVVSGFTSAVGSVDTPAPGGAGGPGGFDGGSGQHIGTGFAASGGRGPGGGAIFSGGGGSGGAYGAPSQFVGLTPLFGGSGGGGGSFFAQANGAGGGGGGGAILIASSTKITVNGSIRANGGDAGGGACPTTSGSGSGGAIRLVAPEIAGGGGNSILQAIPGSWFSSCAAGAPSNGLIRLEANNRTGFTGLTNPTAWAVDAPGPVSPTGTPALANVPTLAIASVGGVAVPATVTGSVSVPDVALPAGMPNPIPVVINATNTPVGSPTDIRLRLVPRGTASTVSVPAANHTGTFASSTATANVTFPVGQVTVLQAYAAMTLTGQFASLFPSIDGEPVERVALAANLGEASTLSLVTKSGKERRVDELPLEDQMRVARAWEVLRSTRTE